jgi:hypothetical protein
MEWRKSCQHVDLALQRTMVEPRGFSTRTPRNHFGQDFSAIRRNDRDWSDLEEAHESNRLGRDIG